VLGEPLRNPWTKPDTAADGESCPAVGKPEEAVVLVGEELVGPAPFVLDVVEDELLEPEPQAASASANAVVAVAADPHFLQADDPLSGAAPFAGEGWSWRVVIARMP
jgi:hypothetical protein